jgi:SAM-dependent methyltransferase
MTDDGSRKYSDGSYRQKNPSWHSEDSQWKARYIAKIMRQNILYPQSVCEIGCGAGEILIELSRLLPSVERFEGYEISTDAYAICGPKGTGLIGFHVGDLLDEDLNFDVVLAIDVIEHVEDYFSFLRRLRARAKYKIFHIPLELSAFEVARRGALLRERQTVGHLHHFNKETALAALEDTGYTILDSFYTASRIEVGQLGWKTRLMKGPRRTLAAVSPDAAARLLGGFSLLVLAE